MADFEQAPIVRAVTCASRAAPFVLCIGLVGCDGSSGVRACSNEILTFDINVEDAASRMSICNASVTVANASGTYSLAAKANDGGAHCPYQPATYDAIPPGPYTVSITAPGYKTSSPQNVTISDAPGQPCVHYTYGASVDVKLTRM